MFTNNYMLFQKYRFLVSYEKSYSYSSYASMINAENATAKFYGLSAGVSDIGGWMKYGRCQAIVGSESTYPHNSSNDAGVYFGTGSTPATVNDYRLESPITSGLSITNPKDLAIKNEGNTYTLSSSMIVTNTTDSDINIYEMGVFTPVMQAYDKAPTTSQSIHYVLMERTVLSEPITVPAGESKLVTYKITFNQGENV